MPDNLRSAAVRHGMPDLRGYADVMLKHNLPRVKLQPLLDLQEDLLHRPTRVCVNRVEVPWSG